MSHTIGGVAVLDVTNRRLLCACHRPGKSTLFACLPYYTPGEQKPEPNGWQVIRNGDELQCQPSVKLSIGLPTEKGVEPVMKEIFHNTFNWSVKFVEVVGSDSDNQLAYLKFKEVNPDYDTATEYSEEETA